VSSITRLRESEADCSRYVELRLQEAHGIETAKAPTAALASANPHIPAALQEECTAPLAELAWSEMATDWQVLYVRVESKEERRRVKVRAAELGFDSYADYVRALIDVDLDKAERADRRRVRR
jgi:hypothetical protein